MSTDSRRSDISKRIIRRACPERCRRDGWNPERQLRFLDALASTRSVTRAAHAAGMSRESAYRLRARADAALFAAAWDKVLRPPQQEGHEVAGKARRVRLLRSAISRANPPKVTKFVKFVSPEFRPRSAQPV